MSDKGKLHAAIMNIPQDLGAAIERPPLTAAAAYAKGHRDARHAAAELASAAWSARDSEVERLREAFERAMKQTWQMVAPIRPPPAGTYAMGENNGICAALKTIRENFEREVTRALSSQDKESA